MKRRHSSHATDSRTATSYISRECATFLLLSLVSECEKFRPLLCGGTLELAKVDESVNELAA